LTRGRFNNPFRQRKFVGNQQDPMIAFGELLEDRGGPSSENGG